MSLGKNVADYAVMLAMAPTVAELPDDVDALKAMVLAIAAEAAGREDIAAEKARLATENANLTQLNQVADERIATLPAIVNILERARFGTRSERLRIDVSTEEQHAIVFHEIETGVAALEAELERASKDKPKRTPWPRKGFGAHLERIRQIIEPQSPAGCEDLDNILIGEDVSERLDVTSTKFRMTRRPEIRLSRPRWRDPGAGTAPHHRQRHPARDGGRR